jgi:lipopolysaccharide transport system permease protein
MNDVSIVEQEEIVIGPPQKFLLNLPELWQYRELFFFFTWRDVKVKYKQTALGFIWVVLQPLFMMLVFTLFFGRALKTPSEGMPYPIFVFSGLLLWNLFASAVNNAGSSMITNGAIIKKIYFPRLIIPLAAVLVSLVDFIVSLFVFFVFLLIFPSPVNVWNALLCWPLAILLTLVGTVGLGCWLSALTVKYRDFRFIVPFLIQIGFFVAPVVYPVSILKVEWMNYLLALNPMYGAITLFRSPLISAPLDMNLIAISVASAFVLFMIGVHYFRKTELFFADLA